MKSRLSANAITVAVSGDVTNAFIDGFPSFLSAKLRINGVTIEICTFGSYISDFGLCHIPIQSPQELDKIIAPTDSNVSCIPSLEILALTCCDPGDYINGIFNSNPASFACCTNDASRDE